MMMIESAAANHVGLARLEASDGPMLRSFFYLLSPQTVYRRFHSPIVRPEQAQPDRLFDLDHHDREAVVAVVDGAIVGVARYARRTGSDAAEVAVVVADAWQRQGLAIRLLCALGELAQAAGVKRFLLEMQAENQPVLHLVKRIYPDAALTHSQGIFEAVVALSRPEPG